MELDFNHELARKSIWIDKDRCGGVPCIKNHRITIAHLLSEIGEGNDVRQFAIDFDVKEKPLRDIFKWLTIMFEK